jgi:methylated-DNA-[protein]-cysteine S-methyltransferase
MKIEDGIYEFVIDGITIKVNSLGNVIQGIGFAFSGGNNPDKNISGPDSGLFDYFRDYIRGKALIFRPALNWDKVTAFQKLVYRAALTIPYGSTISYQELAEKIGGRKYARAVGTALAKNPFPLAVPCHRILPKNSNIENPGRFGGGTPLKRKLLKIEEGCKSAALMPLH